ALHELVLDDLRGAYERVLAEGDRPVVVGEVLPVRPRQHRTQVELAKGLRAADAAGDTARDREARHVWLRKLRAGDAHVGPRARRLHFRLIEQVLAVDEDRDAVILLQAVDMAANHRFAEWHQPI